MVALVAALAAALAVAAPAAATVDLPRTVYILAPGDPDAASDYRELWRAVQAHLTALPVDVRLLTIDEEIDDELARGVAGETRALLVAWLAADRGQFHHLVPAQGEQAQTRDLADAGEVWLDRCQVIASVVHAELGTLPELQRAAETPGSEGGPVADGGGDADPESGPLPLDPDGAAGVPAEPAPAPVAVLVTAGYTLFRTSASSPPLHGVGLGLGVRLGRHVGLRGGVDLGQATPLDNAGDEARVTRWPIRLSTTGELALRRLDLAGRAGLLVDVSRVRDLGFMPAEADALETRIDLGFALGLELRVRVLPWLAPFVAGGVDLYAEGRSYELEGVSVARRGVAVPHLVVGVAWILGKGPSP